MKSKLEFLTLGAEVRRYHTLSVHHPETVGHHSHGVALLCTLIEPDASAELLKAALMHDLAEQVVGDIPSPAKRGLGFGEKLADMELSVLRSEYEESPSLTRYEARVLKLADIAQGALFCLREIEMGNRRMRIVLDRYLSYAEEMNPVMREREVFDAIQEKANECK